MREADSLQDQQTQPGAEYLPQGQREYLLPGQIEHRSYSLPNRESLLVFLQHGVPLSWMRLKTDELLIAADIDEALTTSPWVRMRVGDIHPEAEPIPMVYSLSKHELSVVDLGLKALDPTSKKYQPASVETTEQDLSAGEPPSITSQKAAAKQRLDGIIGPRLNGKRQSVLLHPDLNGGRIYHLFVDDAIEQASLIPGDINSQDKRYNPNDRKTQRLLINGQIPLYQKGGSLLVRVSPENGSYLYLSPNFGKTRVVATSIMEWAVNPNTGTLGNLIRATLGENTPNPAIQKIRQHFVQEVLSHARLIHRPEQPLINHLQQKDGPLINAVRGLMTDGQPNPLTELLASMHSDVVDYLLTQVYPQDLGDTELDRLVLGKLNQSVPEWAISESLQQGMSLPNLLHVAAQYEAVGLIKKRAEQVVQALSLWYLASQIGANPAPYRENLQSLLENQLPNMETLRGVASRLTPSLADVTNMLQQVGSYSPPRPATEQIPGLETLPVENVDLGPLLVRKDIPSTIEGFQYHPEYVVSYPEVVLRCLGQILTEYNQAFSHLVRNAREWETDYQYCQTDGGFVNYFVQVDMAGLPQSFLKAAASGRLNEEAIKQTLRQRIFEIENSLAMYNFMGGIFARKGKDSYFRKMFCRSLDWLRKKYGMPIALLAVTEPKYQAMRKTEFGKAHPQDLLTDEEVRVLSGFDHFFGPEEFAQYLQANGGKNGYLLYARTSLPVAALKDPGKRQDIHPALLSDPQLRQIIRQSALTFNIDAPDTTLPQTINDTKAYMGPMGLAYPVASMQDLGQDLQDFLISRGIQPEYTDAVLLRAKPMHLSYGGYGHTRGQLRSAEFRRALEQGLRERGPYVIQPEVSPALIKDASNNKTYGIIHRLFCFSPSLNPEDMVFLGGFGNMIPQESKEYQRGRIHGSGDAVWVEILPEEV